MEKLFLGRRLSLALAAAIAVFAHGAEAKVRACDADNGGLSLSPGVLRYGLRRQSRPRPSHGRRPRQHALGLVEIHRELMTAAARRIMAVKL